MTAGEFFYPPNARPYAPRLRLVVKVLLSFRTQTKHLVSRWRLNLNMADPLSLVASLIAVVQISGSVISCCYEYRKGVKNAPKDLLRVTNEVAGLRNVVERLVTLIDDEKMASHKYLSTLADIVSADGPLELCQQDLRSLKIKLEPPINECKALGRRLTWPLHEKDITKIIASVYRTKSLLETALMIDNT